ncbi:ATG1B, partial [Symbiodinium necroappetens]
MTRKQVAGYSLERRIGKGSYATVWKGRDDSNESVAVKVISRQTVTETAQLRQEVEVLRKISHPNIVRFRDLKKSAAHFYLVLEYCAGGDLSQFLREKGRVQEETARRFLTQIAEGLSVLHQVNVLHRDLKPQNILLSDSSMDPVLKIADFGFARALPPQDMAATVCGSPLYMAPEILRHEPYDAKADLWSVGAILFELLMGRTPFSGANPMQLLANIEKSPELSFEGVQLSPEGQKFLRALLVSPAQRLSSQ